MPVVSSYPGGKQGVAWGAVHTSSLTLFLSLLRRFLISLEILENNLVGFFLGVVGSVVALMSPG